MLAYVFSRQRNPKGLLQVLRSCAEGDPAIPWSLLASGEEWAGLPLTELAPLLLADPAELTAGEVAAAADV